MATELRNRAPTKGVNTTSHDLDATVNLSGAGGASKPALHPSGKEQHGRAIQILRGLLFAVYFIGGCTAYAEHRILLVPLLPTNQLCSSIHLTQLLGVPLYWVNRDLYDAHMTLTKQSFGILITTMTNWWSPTTIRISGDASVAEQIRKTKDGRAELLFPERLILIANHQVGSREKGVYARARI